MNFIHSYYPASNGQSEVTLVLLHGTGGNEEDLVPLGKFLAPDAALLGVRGQVLEHGAPRFFRRLAEGVFDEEDLVHRTNELADFLVEAASAYELQGSRFVAVGYSNGANIAASTLLLRPEIFSHAILFRAMVPHQRAITPDLTGVQVLMQSGQADPLIPAENSSTLADMLKTAGADVTHHIEMAGHGLTNEEFSKARQWFQEKVNI